MYNTLCLSSIKIKLVIYGIWLVSFHRFAHFLYQFLILVYFSFFYSKFCSKMYLIVRHDTMHSPKLDEINISQLLMKGYTPACTFVFHIVPFTMKMLLHD